MFAKNSLHPNYNGGTFQARMSRKPARLWKSKTRYCRDGLISLTGSYQNIIGHRATNMCVGSRCFVIRALAADNCVSVKGWNDHLRLSLSLAIKMLRRNQPIRRVRMRNIRVQRKDSMPFGMSGCDAR